MLSTAVNCYEAELLMYTYRWLSFNGITLSGFSSTGLDVCKYSGNVDAVVLQKTDRKTAIIAIITCTKR